MSQGLACLEFDVSDQNSVKSFFLCRDFKPQNLLMFDHGKTIKISDFGTARDLTLSTMSQKGSLVYMAPELKEGRGHFTEKIDTYSFGVTIWQMVTQMRPFEEFNDTMLIPTSSIPGEPEELVNLMVKMFHQEPKERPKMVKISSKLDDLTTKYREGYSCYFKLCMFLNLSLSITESETMLFFK